MKVQPVRQLVSVRTGSTGKKSTIPLCTGSNQVPISFTSNGFLTDSVIGGDGDPPDPVVKPKGRGGRYPR